MTTVDGTQSLIKLDGPVQQVEGVFVIFDENGWVWKFPARNVAAIVERDGSD